ncbi:LOW QUALITY PROTEIN: maestro heat-like repeat-containing protein family member 7, partial [Pithys albifrons albifrons]|uniref:LOW QUALITY PROTEIN: maestro heat-like repeat-containing protein family member 7 n=1 Tax=Pithys albifrons albifrons TaxID=3385563 RepID=UPI003A5D1B24
MRKEEEGPGAAPVQQLEEVEQFHPLQEDPGWDRRQEQDRARGRFRSAAQMICEFIRCILHEETTFMGSGDTANSDLCNAEAGAAILHLLVDNHVYKPQQGPAIVRYIHWWLSCNVADEHRLYQTLLVLSEAHPGNVVVTLLRCAPSCDRAAETMWRTIISSGKTVEPVLQILFLVLPYWPAHRIRTSDGDDTDVFALAATVALWKILRLPWCPGPVMENSPCLHMALLFQIFATTQQMPEEVDTLWRRCQEQHCFTTTVNRCCMPVLFPCHALRAGARPLCMTGLCSAQRLAVRTIRPLLCHLGCEVVLMSMERRCGWDTPLNADTHHYAVGLLARELCRVCKWLSYSIALSLLELLSREEFCWELPALAFLVEVIPMASTAWPCCLQLPALWQLQLPGTVPVPRAAAWAQPCAGPGSCCPGTPSLLYAFQALHCLDTRECSDSVLQILSRHLCSECPERRRLALRGLEVLSEDPVMADDIWNLAESLREALRDADRDIVGMTLFVFINVLQSKAIQISSPTALKLAEAIWPLLDHEFSPVQQLSMVLFTGVMEVVEGAGKNILEPQVCLSLLPLYFHWHNKNKRVTKASQKALLRAATFLKRRDLEHLVTMEQPWRLSKCLLQKEQSRAAEYVRQALPYLQSRQEAQRELPSGSWVSPQRGALPGCCSG